LSNINQVDQGWLYSEKVHNGDCHHFALDPRF
jgi:hypothetical protein